ncbi:glycosyltransferase [Cronbergia sp. UHCC 0137]|uniref:glycosyltransferase n=1 Tax=Cronbergia sp. UHCC 0137 TaxID=3110239 RepID=UPI002B1F9FB7|nr:glycosyltransferase [Cronbergia sp. UHCC 0137]MEA5619905.1 glycosyltransferase [Cronbergia sp. UHCC 0137]
MSQPLVSAIIAVQNGEKYLAQAIDSIVSQTYPKVEILVIDDKSTDRTAAIAKGYPQVVYLRHTGRGLADAWNTGLNAAKGEIIAFLDHDDYWASNKLALQVDYLIQHPEVQAAIAHCCFILADPTQPIPTGFKSKLLQKEQVARIPGTLVVYKTVFDLIGQFDPNLTIASDVDWFARAKDQNISMFVIPEVLLYKRVHNNNLSANAIVNNQEILGILRKSIKRQKTNLL